MPRISGLGLTATSALAETASAKPLWGLVAPPPPPVVISPPAAPRRGGRFPEILPAIRYLETVRIILQSTWTVIGDDRVIHSEPVRVSLSTQLSILATPRFIRAEIRAICYLFLPQSLSQEQVVQTRYYHYLGELPVTVLPDNSRHRVNPRRERIMSHLWRFLQLGIEDIYTQ